MSTTEPTRLINEKQAAEMLGLSTKTMQKWRWLGEGPQWCKVGRAVKYRITDLEAYIQSCVQTREQSV